jgi:hypothetical protein
MTGKDCKHPSEEGNPDFAVAKPGSKPVHGLLA